MKISYTFRDMDSSQALKDLADEKLPRKLGPFMTPAADLHVIVEMEGKLHKIELTLKDKNLKTGAAAESDDMYKSLAQAMDKLERQLRRHKERRTEHR